MVRIDLGQVYSHLTNIPVHIIRFIEKRIDQLFDAALLDFSSPKSDIDSVQFESDWSFLRPFSGKKKPQQQTVPSSPPSSPGRPVSPIPNSTSVTATASKSFSSLRRSFHARTSSSSTPLSSLFPDSSPHTPHDLTTFLTAVHTLFILSQVNPSTTLQIWSQVMYWTSCKSSLAIFNHCLYELRR